MTRESMTKNMARTIEVVIRISEEDFKIMQHNIRVNNPLCPLSEDKMVSKVANGIPLPEGHGRLGDLDELEKEMENGIRAGLLEEGYDNYPHINNVDDCVECIKYADTIIEADKEKRDADSD